MNFLSNLWNSTKNAAKSVGNWLTGAPAGQNTSQLADVSASLWKPNQLGTTNVPTIGGATSRNLATGTSNSTLAGVVPTSPTIGTFTSDSIKTASSSAGSVQYVAPGSQSIYSTPQKDPTLIAPQPRTVNPYASTGGQSINYDSPNYGSGTSSYGSGSAYNTYNPPSVPSYSYIPPTIIGPMPGSTGISGTGGYIPQGMGSVSGTQGSGGSNYTGTLAGTSGIGTPSMNPGSYSSMEEEQRRKQQGSTNQPPAFIPIQNPYQVPQGFTQTQTPQGGSAFKDAVGNTYIRTSNGLELKSSLPGQLGTQQIGGDSFISPHAVSDVNLAINPLASKSQFRAQTPSGALDLSAASARISEISKMLSSGGISSADAGTFYNELQNIHASLVQAKLAENPLLQNGFVQETPEQAQFIEQFPEQQKGSIRASMDAARTKLGLPKIEADLAKVQTELQTYEELQSQVFKELMENPDMPAGLKQKRLDDFNRRNSLAIQNLQGKMKILEQQKAYANEALDREFNIMQLEDNQRERSRNNALQQLQMFISSGGIANFSDEALNQAAIATGLPVGQLQAIKGAVSGKQVKDKYAQFSTQLDNDGNITVLGITPEGQVEILEQVGGVGKVNEPSQGQFTAANYATRIQQANPILESNTQAVVGMNQLSYEAQLRLPASLQTATMQNYMQASRNFINAVLRRESGAVISPTEFAEARQQYLPQPGDNPQVLEQKRQNRMLIQQNFSNEAGRALQSGSTTTQPYPVGTIAQFNGGTYKKVQGGWQLVQ